MHDFQVRIPLPQVDAWRKLKKNRKPVKAAEYILAKVHRAVRSMCEAQRSGARLVRDEGTGSYKIERAYVERDAMCFDVARSINIYAYRWRL